MNTAHRFETNIDWREEAVNQALDAEAVSGEGMDALLSAIRRRRPDAALLLFWLDRLQLKRFLQTQASDFRSLLAGSNGHIERNELCPYTDWYAAVWEETPVEVALTPGYHVEDCVICIADDKTFLRRFAEALEDFAARPEGRSLCYSRHWESSPALDAEIGSVTWEDVTLAPNIIADVREAVEGFYKHREAFAALGFPWRRGLLLVGPPGTGKTMLCKAAAAALPDLPFLYVRDFQAGDDNHKDAIKAIFRRARKLAPCLLAFEDIDGLVTPENRTVFLNELDGFQNNNGLLIIASSNHPDKIDEALLKRPSRFDRVFHIGLPALAERREYCLRLLSRSSLTERIAPGLDMAALAQKVAERSGGFTPAYLKEAFITAALQRAQAGAVVLDERFAEAVATQVEALRKHLRRLREPDTLRELHSSDADLIGIRRNRS